MSDKLNVPHDLDPVHGELARVAEAGAGLDLDKLREVAGRAGTHFPAVLDGHWSTSEGQEMAVTYANRTRASLALSTMTDFELANAVFMADRSSLSLISFQTAAKERIRWLSAQLALAQSALARVKALEAAAGQALQLIDVALPQFDWGRSCLSAEAIRLLNEVPNALRVALLPEKDQER